LKDIRPAKRYNTWQKPGILTKRAFQVKHALPGDDKI